MSQDRDAVQSTDASNGVSSLRVDLLKFTSKIALDQLSALGEEADRIRTRILSLLGFFAAATAFIAKYALDTHPHRDQVFIAISAGATAGIALLTLVSFLALRPSQRWSRPSAIDIANDLVLDPQIGRTEESFYTELIQTCAGAEEENFEILSKLHNYSRIALLSGVLEISMWVWLAWMRP